MIFVYPIFTQSIHLIWHQAYHHGHHCTECKHSEHTESVRFLASLVSKSEKHCVICEYEFPINDLPGNKLIESNLCILNYCLKEIAVNQFTPYILSKKYLRAPPVPTG